MFSGTLSLQSYEFLTVVRRSKDDRSRNILRLQTRENKDGLHQKITLNLLKSARESYQHCENSLFLEVSTTKIKLELKADCNSFKRTSYTSVRVRFTNTTNKVKLRGVSTKGSKGGAKVEFFVTSIHPGTRALNVPRVLAGHSSLFTVFLPIFLLLQKNLVKNDLPKE